MKAKRLARYLLNRRRFITDYKFQKMPTEVVVWSDSDFAGCLITRKSTSGGVVMFGGHCIKTYSSTQPVIALPPGEAEFYAIVKAGSTGVGMRSLFADFGIKMTIRLNTDSETGKSIASRKGAGIVRHIDTDDMWIQEKVAKKDIFLKKVPGKENISDGLTKHVERPKLDKYLAGSNQRLMPGGHELCPQIAD